MTDRFDFDGLRAEPLARALLGARLVRILEDGTRLAGRIVETEAYLGAVDKGAHTYGGRRTKRTETMFLGAGHGYVYLVYGMHHCFNVVADPAGEGEAVLVRALEPLEGIEAMQARRPPARREPELCAGPGRLTAAMEITRAHDREDLRTSTRLWIESGEPVADAVVARGPRIGIDYAEEWADRPLRYAVEASPALSRPMPGP